jgi:hypothetical protein
MKRPSQPKTAPVFAALLLTLTLIGPLESQGATIIGDNWSPKVTERLVRLPGKYIHKEVDNDFSNSKLAQDLTDLEGEIQNKMQTLTDLKGALSQAEGEFAVEIKHQILAEKRGYVNMMNRHVSLRRERLKTSVKLYEAVLDKMKQKGAKGAIEGAL